MPQATVQLFVNPAAGSWSEKRVTALVAAFEAAGARVIVAQSASGEPAIAAEADHIVAVGGDGTLRHVAAAVARAGRPLALSIYPTGTVNLVARECGYTLDPAAFADRVLNDAPLRHHHLGLIGTTPLFSCASVGPDSFAVAGLSSDLKNRIGRAAYVVSLAKLLGRWPRPKLRVTADRHMTDCEAVYIAKGLFFAGPWSFAPDAALDRPLLHIVALHRATRLDYLQFLWTLWRGRALAGHHNITTFTCADVAIEGADAPLQADGDIVARLPARITLSPDTLAFS